MNCCPPERTFVGGGAERIVRDGDRGIYRPISHESTQTHINVTYPPSPMEPTIASGVGGVNVLSGRDEQPICYRIAETRSVLFSIYHVNSLKDQGKFFVTREPRPSARDLDVDGRWCDWAAGSKNQNWLRCKARAKSSDHGRNRQAARAFANWFFLNRVVTLDEVRAQDRP